jgi:Ca2+-binding EF-hand superfamily protein
MKKSWLVIPAMVMSMGMAFAPAASADEVFKFEDFFKMADANKDGMMSRKEFMDAMGKRYDANMDKMKKMGDKGKMMMKGDAMTKEGVKMLFTEWQAYGGGN